MRHQPRRTAMRKQASLPRKGTAVVLVLTAVHPIIPSLPVILPPSKCRPWLKMLTALSKPSDACLRSSM